MFDRPSLIRIAPFALYILFIALADGLLRWGLTAAELRWLYPVKIAAVLGLLWYWRREYVELAWPDNPAASLGLQPVAVGLLVFIAWINLTADWMTIGHSVGYPPAGKDDVSAWLLMAIRLGGAALVVPVMEELFWRSFLLRWLTQTEFGQLDPARISLKAVAITAIFFAVEHTLWLAGLIAGIAYSLLYQRSRTIWSPILAHGVTNGLLGAWVIYTGSWEFW